MYILEPDAQKFYHLVKVSTCKTYLPLITERVGSHLGGHSLLIESAQLTLIINFNQLLAASSGE